jgi:outer membrane protein
VKRQLEQVQQRFEVGLVAITDVLEAQAVYDNTVVRRIQADADQDIFFESLRTLTGRSYSELNRISDSLPIVDPDPQNEDEWVNTALQSNLNIQSAQAQVLAAERTLKARRSGHLPTIDVSVTESHFVTGGLNFLGDTTNQTTYAASINVPIYQGGLTSARAREARALADQSRQFLLEQQLNVTRNTRSLFRAVATDVVRVRARLKSIQSSESALEAVETGYEVGTRNIVDVLQAQQLLYRSEFDFADSRYNYMSNFLLLKRSVGTLEEADLLDLNAYSDAGDPVQRVNSLLNRSVDLGSQQR